MACTLVATTVALEENRFLAGTQVVVDMHLAPAAPVADSGDAGSGGRGLEALGTTLLLVGLVGVVPWERRRRREERKEREERQRDQALRDLFEGDDLLGDREPADGWWGGSAEDGHYAAACDSLFGESGHAWQSDTALAVVTRRAMQSAGPILAPGDPEEIVLPRRPAARDYRHAKTARRSRGLGFVGRASILWLAACSVLGLLCLWCGSDAGHGPTVAKAQLAAPKRPPSTARAVSRICARATWSWPGTR